MANIYSVKLYSGNPAGGYHSIYTVPAGYIAVVRDIRAFNGSPYYTACLGFYLADTTSGTIFFDLQQTQARAMHQFATECRVVIPAGSGISCSMATAEAGAWSIYISGYQLTTP